MSQTTTTTAITTPAPPHLASPSIPETVLTRTRSHNLRQSSETQIQNAQASDDVAVEDLSKGRTFVVILSVTVITGISSLLAGIVTVGLPTIARDLRLESNLLLWYVRSAFFSFLYRYTCDTPCLFGDCFCGPGFFLEERAGLIVTGKCGKSLCIWMGQF
jgi:hypothetical protein